MGGLGILYFRGRKKQTNSNFGFKGNTLSKRKVGVVAPTKATTFRQLKSNSCCKDVTKFGVFVGMSHTISFSLNFPNSPVEETRVRPLHVSILTPCLHFSLNFFGFFFSPASVMFTYFMQPFFFLRLRKINIIN